MAPATAPVSVEDILQSVARDVPTDPSTSNATNSGPPTEAEPRSPVRLFFAACPPHRFARRARIPIVTTAGMLKRDRTRLRACRTRDLRADLVRAELSEPLHPLDIRVIGREFARQPSETSRDQVRR